MICELFLRLFHQQFTLTSYAIDKEHPEISLLSDERWVVGWGSGGCLTCSDKQGNKCISQLAAGVLSGYI